MPYRICRSFEIENGHMLSKHPDLCKFPHGHSRKIEFVLEADTLDQNEMVCDFKVLKDAMGEFLRTWDHALCVNTADPQFAVLRQTYGERIVSFENQDPTTEVMAKTLYDLLRTRLAAYARESGHRYSLRPMVRVISVRLWETSRSWAEYSEEKS